MRIFRKKVTPEADNCDHEVRLALAENRANNVYEKAMWLRTIVARRDDENHWQESVSSLFQGGST